MLVVETSAWVAMVLREEGHQKLILQLLLELEIGIAAPGLS